jgi:hypothetical protein
MQPVPPFESRRTRPTRRDVLCAAAAASLGALRLAAQDVPVPAETQPVRSASPLPRPWWLAAEPQRSRVVDIRSDKVLRGSSVDSLELEAMLRRAITTLTRASTHEEGWRSILGEARRIVIKFNSVGAEVLRTTDSLARVLVSELGRAGYAADQIALVEVSRYLAQELGTREPPAGWGQAIPVGDRAEPLANYLLEANAIINVPFVKTHQIAGMSGSLKNLSHAVIRHPARYHADGCSPFVGQVVGSAEVASRLRLNVTNALRIVVDRGPDAQEEDLVHCGGLIVGFDPVAVDSIGLGLLSVERRRKGLPWTIRVPHLVAAGDDGVGRWRPSDIDRIAIDAAG